MQTVTLKKKNAYAYNCMLPVLQQLTLYYSRKSLIHALMQVVNGTGTVHFILCLYPHFCIYVCESIFFICTLCKLMPGTSAELVHKLLYTNNEHDYASVVISDRLTQRRKKLC